MTEKTERKTSDKGETERAVGRRKTAAARVRIASGTGEITVNGTSMQVYFPLHIWQKKILSPLVVAGKETSLDVFVKVAGGGIAGQADAVRHGIARALVLWNPDFRPMLRAEKLLTRDPRQKERKKFGLHKARRAHQWRKR